MKKTLLFLSIFIFTAALFAETEFSSRALERMVFSAVNAQRVKAGLQPLKINLELAKIARAHSQDMAARNYTNHVNPEGLDPSQRAKKTGFDIVKKKKNSVRKGVGENIYEMQSYMQREDGLITYYIDTMDNITRKAIEGWMSSAGHRKNIMNPDYTMAGVGVAAGKDKKVKITQVFF